MLRPGEAWSLGKRAVQGWVDDSASSMGAALAFYTLFSLAPLLLLAIARGRLLHRAATRRRTLLIAQLSRAARRQGRARRRDAARRGGQPRCEAGSCPRSSAPRTLARRRDHGVRRAAHRPRPHLALHAGKAEAASWSFVRTRCSPSAWWSRIGFLLLVSLRREHARSRRSASTLVRRRQLLVARARVRWPRSS